MEYPDGEDAARYQLLVLMDPRDDVIFHELAMVLGAVRTQIPNVESALLDETDDAYIARVFASAKPFFTAVDYKRPRSRKG